MCFIKKKKKKNPVHITFALLSCVSETFVVHSVDLSSTE